MRYREQKIIDVLNKFNSIKAIYIAKKLSLNKRQVNSILYSSQNVKYHLDSNYHWSLIDNKLTKKGRLFKF